jgi:general secretion pathway protein G
VKTIHLIKKHRLILACKNGFSLIEILVALTLMAVAGAFVTGKIFDQLHEGKANASKIQMQSLAQRLKEFRRHCGFYPSTEMGLEALISKPTSGRECKSYAPNGYIDSDSVPLDPWDNDYNYISDQKTFNIISFAADGLEGGEDKDKDIPHKNKKK